MTTPFTQIQLRNGTFQEWYDANPILALGEPGFEINTGKLKIGDGVKRWNELDYMSCCPKTSPTPTPTAPGANTIFISWEDCYGAGSIEQIPNKFGHFDLCGLPCPVSKDVRFYFQNNLEELHKRTKDLTPYNENYNYTCDTVDGNDTIVIRVEKGTGLKLELDSLVECTKPKPICNCSCCPVTPSPTPAIPECLSYGGVKVVLSACHGCDRAKYNLYVGGLTDGVWDDSQEVLIEEININSFDGPNVVTESPYPCGTDPCCVSNCGAILSVQEVTVPSETIAGLPLIPSEANCITIPVKLKCLLSNCHSNVTQYLAFSEGGCCVGSGTLDSQVDTGSGVGVQTITICCGACATPTPTPTRTPTPTPTEGVYISSYTPSITLPRVDGCQDFLSITLMEGLPDLYFRWYVRPSGGGESQWIPCDYIVPGYDYYGYTGGNSWPLPHSTSLSVGYWLRDISPGNTDPSLYVFGNAPVVTSLDGAEFRVSISDVTLANVIKTSQVMRVFLSPLITPTPTPPF
jgi:hypothetical protein